MTDFKKTFVRGLLFLAKECGKELSTDHFEYYDRVLASLGYEKAAYVIQSFLFNRRSRDSFPTPKELLLRALSSDESGEEISSRIIGAIPKFGYTNPEGARTYIGEAGWKIIEREGGWSQTCSSTLVDQLPTLRAQWRRAADKEIESQAEVAVGKALEAGYLKILENK